MAQSALERQIASIAAEAEGRVSVHLVESGKLSLDQPVRFRASDRILPQTYSPLRELLRLAVSLSDNAAADVVLRTIGGPAVVDAFFASSGGFHLEDNEAGLHRDHASQYRNWWEPAAAVALLRRLDEHSPLTPAHTALLFGWMQDSPSAGRRIGAELPAGAVVRHKSGTSFTERGLTAATNDIGLIALPDGRHLAVAIFVTDSKADEATRERVIARIARAAYDAAAATSK